VLPGVDILIAICFSKVPYSHMSKVSQDPKEKSSLGKMAAVFFCP